MKFWKFIFCLFMWLCIPYKVTKKYYKGHNLKFIHVKIMPWAVGMTIGNWVFTTYTPENLETRKRKPFIHHEFIHYKQWVEHGWKFIPLYIWYSIIGLLKYGKPYERNKFEVEAFKAENVYRRHIGLGYYSKWDDIEF